MPTLAPAGGFVSPWQLASMLTGWRLSSDSGNGKRELVEQLQETFSVSEVALCASGKDAIWRILTNIRSQFSALDHPAVAVGAYTCPDVAVAAIAAGFRIYPLELDGSTLSPLPPPPEEVARHQVVAVLFSNLYGILDSASSWRSLVESSPLWVIDDLCQAALGRVSDRIAGWGERGAAVLSFGRGKAICGAGGGAVIGSSSALRNLTGSALAEHRHSGTLEASVRFAKAAASWFLEKPPLYSVPANLPFLRLGETVVELNFQKDRSCGLVETAAAACQLSMRAESARSATAKAFRYEKLLNFQTITQPYIFSESQADSAPIRYPIMTKSKESKEQLLSDLCEAGLGASRSYPKVLADFPEISGWLIPSLTPVARSIAETIITLPVHRYVEERHLERIAEIIRSCVAA